MIDVIRSINILTTPIAPALLFIVLVAHILGRVRTWRSKHSGATVANLDTPLLDMLAVVFWAVFMSISFRSPRIAIVPTSSAGTNFLWVTRISTALLGAYLFGVTLAPILYDFPCARSVGGSPLALVIGVLLPTFRRGIDSGLTGVRTRTAPRLQAALYSLFRLEKFSRGREAALTFCASAHVHRMPV